MENYQTFKLIEGKFSTIESREILQSIFSSKMQFHQMKNFSSQEHFAKDDSIALERIQQLKESLSEIFKMLEYAQKSGNKLLIKSQIEISMIEPIENL